MPTCGIVTFRLSEHDGVSAVIRQWRRVLEDLGLTTLTIAGSGEADHILPGLAIGASAPPTASELTAALDTCDFILVENIGTIPLNLSASLLLLKCLRGRPAVFHHHDPPWQRPQHGHIRDLPADDPAWSHVVINDFTKAQLEALEFSVTRIYNAVDSDLPAGNRSQTRQQLGVADDELLVVHPTRAIRLKNIPAAIALTEKLGGVYWLVGPAEEDYQETLTQLLADAQCRIITTSNNQLADPMGDMYAACDLVAYPSIWESFGIPPIEAAMRQVPAVVGDYPIAEEQRSLGMRWPYPWETKELKQLLAGQPTGQLAELLEHNRATAIKHFSQTVIAKQIEDFLKQINWL